MDNSAVNSGNEAGQSFQAKQTVKKNPWIWLWVLLGLLGFGVLGVNWSRAGGGDKSYSDSIPNLVPYTPPPPSPPATSQVTATDFGYTMKEFVDTFNGLRTDIRVRSYPLCWTASSSGEYYCAYRGTNEPIDAAFTVDLTSQKPFDKIKSVELSATLKKGSPSAAKWVLAACTAVVSLLNPEVADKAELVNSMARAISRNGDGVDEIRQIGRVEYKMRSSEYEEANIGGILSFSFSASLSTAPR